MMSFSSTQYHSSRGRYLFLLHRLIEVRGQVAQDKAESVYTPRKLCDFGNSHEGIFQAPPFRGIRYR